MHIRLLLLVIAGLLALHCQSARAQAELPPPGPGGAGPAADMPADPEGLVTLTQGPIHEAFANPAELNPEPGPLAPREPPPPVNEEPPEYMPEGAAFLPGYWLWDDDRDDFIWVTGVARVPPPSQRWVPGYWTAADGGWQRVSGFWMPEEVTEVNYVPTAPPATLEVGPSSPSPGDNYFWVPGSWVYQNANYAWQAGYWTPLQTNWIWVPARWIWTPAGFAFLPGHWDYRLGYRGQIFAPVYFSRPIYQQPAFVYRPWCVIPTTNLFIHLWLRPRWNYYYFGNYYGPQYASRGFMPWANLAVTSRQRYVYDPFFTYAHTYYRQQGIDYIGRVEGWHRYFAEHQDLRPPRTWHEERERLATHRGPTVQTQLLAAPIQQVAKSRELPLPLTRLDNEALRRQTQYAAHVRELHSERLKLERHGAPGGAAVNLPAIHPPREGGRDAAREAVTANAGQQTPVRLKLPRTELPVVGSTTGIQTGQAQAITGHTRTPAPPHPVGTARTGGDRTPGSLSTGRERLNGQTTFGSGRDVLERQKGREKLNDAGEKVRNTTRLPDQRERGRGTVLSEQGNTTTNPVNPVGPNHLLTPAGPQLPRLEPPSGTTTNPVNPVSPNHLLTPAGPQLPRLEPPSGTTTNPVTPVGPNHLLTPTGPQLPRLEPPSGTLPQAREHQPSIGVPKVDRQRPLERNVPEVAPNHPGRSSFVPTVPNTPLGTVPPSGLPRNRLDLPRVDSRSKGRELPSVQPPLNVPSNGPPRINPKGAGNAPVPGIQPPGKSNDSSSPRGKRGKGQPGNP